MDLVQLVERVEAAYEPVMLAMSADTLSLYKQALPHVIKTGAAPVVAEPVKVDAAKSVVVRRAGVSTRPAPIHTLITESHASSEDQEEDSDDVDPGDDLGDLDAAYRSDAPPEADPMSTLEGEPEAVLVRSSIVDDGWTNPFGLGISQAPPPDAPPRPPVLVPLVRRPAPMSRSTKPTPPTSVKAAQGEPIDEEDLPDWARSDTQSEVRRLEAERAARKGLTR